MADEVKQLTGEERIDALCKTLEEKHGFHFSEEIYKPKEETKFKHSGDGEDAGDWTQHGDGTEYPAFEDQQKIEEKDEYEQ